ncbi:uncharacterized protein [Dermacentor andersoni]|uniref:uncharacterized protein n=1 Tax=Dermacentor andersoni TaxID=34620 RepID=UPI003B3AB1E4
MIAEGAPEPVELNSTPSISVCLADLENAKGPFSDAPVHYGLPCTAAEGQTCQIVRHLSTWNEFLFQVRMEIREVAGARASAQHVEELELQSDGLSSTGVLSALSNLLKTTNSLAVLTIPHVSMSGQDADRFLTALAENKTLKELSMHESVLSEASMAGRARFKEYLKDNNTLTTLVVGKGNELWDSGTENRVSFGTFYASDSFDLLESKAFSEVSVLSFEDFTNVLRLLRRLPSFRHITSVRLDIWTGDIVLSWAFADYVKSSSTLRNLRLWLGSDGASRDDANGWRAALFASLSRNTSIRVLHVTSMYMDEQDVYLLADSITSSRNIEKVHIGTVTLAESGALVRRLSLGIATNYTLLSVSLDSPVDREAAKHFFTVCDVARRNSGLVALAAQFVTGARPGSICAQALERVSNHPALLEVLSESTSMSTEEAAATIRSRLRSIEGLQQFMRLAGVVKERVTCNARDDGRMHLADLNEHCWSHVRRYLKLHDVVYDESMSDNV